MGFDLTGWDIGDADAIEWSPWGGGNARAKALANGDGYFVVLVEAEPGYAGTEHEHEHPEFLYVIDGELSNQGRIMKPGDAYVAATGSKHTEFSTEHGATYVLIFKL